MARKLELKRSPQELARRAEAAEEGKEQGPRTLKVKFTDQRLARRAEAEKRRIGRAQSEFLSQNLLSRTMRDQSERGAEVDDDESMISDDESMISDDDGGVALDFDAMQDTTTSSSRTEIEDHYFQPVTFYIDPEQQLWQPPPGDSLRIPNAKASIFKAAAIYQQSLKLINKHWNCSFETCIPECLQRTTPYSLALLYAIRRLASNTKGNRHIAWSAIEKVFQERTNRQPDLVQSEIKEQYQFVDSLPMNYGLMHPACERGIRENIYGLMIMDIERALLGLRKKEFNDLPTPHEMREARKVERGIDTNKKSKSIRRQRVDKVAHQPSRRERRLIAKFKQLQENREGEQQMRHIAPPNSPVQEGNKFDALWKQITLTINTRKHPQAPEHNNGPVEGATPQLSKHDLKDYMEISHLMNKAGVKPNPPLNKKSRKRLGKGGLSRRVASGVLPSERTDLSKTSILPTQMSGLTAEQLTKLGQLSLDDIAAETS